jgi:hypothetical protein
MRFLQQLSVMFANLSLGRHSISGIEYRHLDSAETVWIKEVGIGNKCHLPSSLT